MKILASGCPARREKTGILKNFILQQLIPITTRRPQQKIN